ncbi:MAG: Na(+)/H(+) antiporter subunit D [Proteobacteria bacterium]|nr:Na(+)/H(+) antiporter subunit D [Pseudomonadota bacterium]MBU1593969.1 Na(+)/H(+) antiporter subunit D [Pseudomonadota bacterium]
MSAITSSFIHPTVGFYALALILPFLRGKAWKWLLLIPPVIAIWSVMTVSPGFYGELNYLGQKLMMGRVDKLSLVFAQVFAVMSLIGMVYALHVEDKLQHIMACVYVGGAFGCTFAGDLLTLFIFWELMSIGSTFLIWLARNPVSTKAGFRYFMYHTIGGLFLLIGLLLRYKAVGTFSFDAVDPHHLMAYDWMILLGFCVNAAVVPLHAWLPDAYPEGTVTGSVFMCAFTTKTAVYVLMRGFAGVELLAIAGTVMCVYGVLYACIENNARRILSYHIVSQVGYMVAGIGIGTAMTLNGATAHAYAHILYKGLLFMGTGCLLYAAGTTKLDKLGGLVHRMPWVMVMYMVAALSISGMPLFNGFISKTMTIVGAAEAHRTWLAIGMEVAAVGTFLSVGIKLPYFAFWAKPANDKIVLKPIPANMYVGMAMGAVLCIAQGLYPDMLYRYLPFEMEHAYHPWTVWHVLQSFMLLGFSGLAFYLTRDIITPHAKTNLDFDFFYRLIGRGVMALVCKPLAWIDDRWTEAYRVAGLSGLLTLARGTMWFDTKGIDTVVDGSAYTVQNVGVLSARVQTGRLQDYLGLAAALALCVFAAVWYFA